MPYVTAGSDDSIPSIASEHGFFWKTVWEHSENAELRQRRKDPGVLFAGDVVFVPEKEIKEVAKPTEQKHRFVRKGEPIMFKIRLTKFNKPRANEKYILKIDDKLYEGVTDGDGQIKQKIPNKARTGLLILQGGKEQYSLEIGGLDPLDEPTGIQHRLNNLGFDCGGEMGEIGEKTIEALKKFQTAHNLAVTGEPDDATKQKLKELHR